MSEIRELLARAQEAETRGRAEEAARLLQQAAAWYRDRQLLKRAAQMLRHARRVQGLPADAEDDARAGDESPFGFDAGEAQPDEAFPPPGPARARRVLVEQREPQRADPSVDAWCSFCCRPRVEVGELVAGPAGAFVCAACAGRSVELLGGAAAPRARPPTHAPSPPLRFELPAQRRARERFERAKGRLTLLVGPEGAGKSAWLRALGAPVEPPLVQWSGPVLLVEASRPLSQDDEARLLAWLEEHPGHRAVVAVRAPAPAPLLVLKGEQGDEPVFDTPSLGAVVTQLSPAALSRVDAVLPLEPPDEAALEALAAALAEAREVSVPREVLRQLVSLAARSGRGAHELAALVSRIPPGRYGA